MSTALVRAVNLVLDRASNRIVALEWMRSRLKKLPGKRPFATLVLLYELPFCPGRLEVT